MTAEADARASFLWSFRKSNKMAPESATEVAAALPPEAAATCGPSVASESPAAAVVDANKSKEKVASDKKRGQRKKVGGASGGADGETVMQSAEAGVVEAGEEQKAIAPLAPGEEQKAIAPPAPADEGIALLEDDIPVTVPKQKTDAAQARRKSGNSVGSDRKVNAASNCAEDGAGSTGGKVSSSSSITMEDIIADLEALRAAAAAGRTEDADQLRLAMFGGEIPGVGSLEDVVLAVRRLARAPLAAAMSAAESDGGGKASVRKKKSTLTALAAKSGESPVPSAAVSAAVLRFREMRNEQSSLWMPP